MALDTNHKLEQIQNGLNITGTSFALLLHLCLSRKLPVPWYALLLCILFVYALMALIDSNKKQVLTWFLLFGLLFASIWQGKLHISFLRSGMHTLIQWILFTPDSPTKDPLPTTLLILLLLFLATSFTVLLYVLNQNRHLRHLTVWLLIFFLLYTGIYGPDMNRFSLALLLTVVIEELLVWNNRLKQKRQHANHPVNTLYLLPICLIIGILPVLLPAREEPIQWKHIKLVGGFLQERIEEITYYASNLLHPLSEEYTLQFVGYSDAEKSFLSGEVKQSKRNILKVTPGDLPRNDIYLIGNVYPNYTSTGWKKEKKPSQTGSGNNTSELTLDMAQMLYGIYKNNVIPPEGERLFHSMHLEIEYQFLQTKSLFYPYKTFQIRMPDAPISYEDTSAALIADKRIKKGFTYEVNYIELNLGSETLQDYFRSQSRLQQSVTTTSSTPLSMSFHQYLDDTLKLYLYKDENYLIQYRNEKDKREAQIQSVNTAVPPTVPQRVYDLAREITAPYDNQYDQLRAIESYLSTYQYTLSPKPMSDGTDFVDSFLFETKSGYCTHFATSMAILARCAGIPTRYVEGVWMDNKKEGHSFYQVKSSASHAWMDAYIKGVGWVPFEPTPGMQQNRYHSWQKIITREIASEVTSPIYSSSTNSTEDGRREIKMQSQNIHMKFMLVLSALILLLLVVFFLLVYLGLHHAKKKRYLHSTKGEQIHSLMVDILYLLEMCGYQIQPAETLHAFSKRVCLPLPDSSHDLPEVLTTYEKYRYSDYLPSDTERDTFHSYKDALMAQIKSTMPAWKRFFFYFKHLLESLRTS